MNSLNIITGTTGSVGLLGYNRSLSLSRHSIDRRSIHSSTSNMAAAMVASNKGSGQTGQEHDDHHHRLIKVDDPVILRTCTVDETFRRMEVRLV